MNINTSQLTIKDSDLIVFKLTEIVPDATLQNICKYIAEYIRSEYPNNKHMVLDYRTDLTVIKSENTRKHKPFKDKIRKA